MPGEITKALNDGDREAVIDLASKRFHRLWASIAGNILPVNRRRSEDEDDVVQETLLQMNRYLACGNTFGDSGDIYRWSAAVASNMAMRARDRNRRYEGPSAVASGNSQEQTIDSNVALELLASNTQINNSKHLPDQIAINDEIRQLLTSLITNLDSQIASLLTESTPVEQSILELYLEWTGASATAKKLSSKIGIKLTEYYVRNVTFLFKESFSIQDQVTTLRSHILLLEVDPTDIAFLLGDSLRVARILTDFRDKP